MNFNLHFFSTVKEHSDFALGILFFRLAPTVIP